MKTTRRVSPNANALNFALKSDIVELNRCARAVILRTWQDSRTVTECARRLDVHPNTMSKLLEQIRT